MQDFEPIDDPEKWIEDMNARAEELKHRAEQASAELTAKQGKATSANGAVTVTVNGNGGLADVKLGHRACELGHTQLSSLIMETFRKAMQDVSRQVMATFQEHFPDAEDSLEYLHRVNPYWAESGEPAPRTWAPGELEEEEPLPVRVPRPVPAATAARPPVSVDDEPADRPW